MFSIPLYSVMLVDFLSRVIMSDRNVAFMNSLHMLSSVRSLPSNTSLRKSSMIKGSSSP